MTERSSSGAPVHAWSGSDRAWPDDPVVRGALRISGTAFDAGASWYVTTDRLGWSSVALISDRGGVHEWDAVGVLRRCAEAALDPMQTALALRDRLRQLSRARCEMTGVAIARIGPDARLVELVNTSLPTVLHWDPIEGISPYEPIFANLDAVTAAASSDMLRLHPGAALVMATEGLLPYDAGWASLGGFVRALGLDVFGGTVADAPPSEIRRVLHSSWGCGDGPAGIVVAGLPGIAQQVA